MPPPHQLASSLPAGCPGPRATQPGVTGPRALYHHASLRDELQPGRPWPGPARLVAGTPGGVTRRGRDPALQKSGKRPSFSPQRPDRYLAARSRQRPRPRLTRPSPAQTSWQWRCQADVTVPGSVPSTRTRLTCINPENRPGLGTHRTCDHEVYLFAYLKEPQRCELVVLCGRGSRCRVRAGAQAVRSHGRVPAAGGGCGPVASWCGPSLRRR